ncbi:MAG: sulfite exporter TauE/SafE family protein [Bacteroidota bacterium]
MTTLLIVIFFIAIFCEFVDASLGMMYGTILSPLLILFGIPVTDVVPAILISQAMGGLIASFRHNYFGNIKLKEKTNHDFKIAMTIFLFGIAAVIIGVFVSVSIPKEALRMYIGILVLIMSSIVLINRKFKFSWKKIYLIGIISSFNKAMSGGGFGPLVSTGLIVSGKESKSSIGITDMAEVPICLSAFVAWIVLNGAILNVWLIVSLCAGALVGAFVGPYFTYKVNEKVLTIIVGILGVLLGILCVFGAKI